jgi:hypothetical protein
MPRTREERGQRLRRRKQPRHPLPRQRQMKPLSKPTMMARERNLNQLSDLITAYEELFEDTTRSVAARAAAW